MRIIIYQYLPPSIFTSPSVPQMPIVTLFPLKEKNWRRSISLWWFHCLECFHFSDEIMSVHPCNLNLKIELYPDGEMLNSIPCAAQVNFFFAFLQTVHFLISNQKTKFALDFCLDLVLLNIHFYVKQLIWWWWIMQFHLCSPKLKAVFDLKL